MKNKLFFITTFTTLLCIKAFSQTKNDWVISIQGSTSKLAASEGTSTLSISSGQKGYEITPSLDYYFKEDLFMGFGIDFSKYVFRCPITGSIAALRLNFFLFFLFWYWLSDFLPGLGVDILTPTISVLPPPPRS